MTRRLPLLDRIDIPSPCTADWDSMTGAGSTRFCEQCSRSVHDLSAMTKRQAQGLVRRSGGRLCVRVTRDASGRTLTAEPLSRHRRPARNSSDATSLPAWISNPAIVSRASRSAASALALALLAATPALAQGQSPIAATARPGAPTGTGSVSGGVTDPQGAFVVGAAVTLTGPRGAATMAVGGDGRFRFDNLPAGSYELTVVGQGFATFEASTFVVTAGESEVFNTVLDPASERIGMTLGGVMAMTVSSKAHCYVWKIKANTDDESEDPVEEAPEPPMLSAIDLGEDELREALDAGTNPNELFAFGRTPLMHAADNEDLVRLLLERGADPSLRDEAGATALHYAALADDGATVFALCRAGCDPNVADFEGITPLIVAALDGNEEAVSALVAAGANVHARDVGGRSALDYAREEEREEVIEILEVAGAK